MKVLVTGAAGNLGSAVCRILTEAGMNVVAADCMHSTDLPVELNVVDLLDFADLYPLLDGCRAAVHLANHLRLRSRRPLQVLYGENASMNMNVFQAAAEVGVEQILYSSSVQAIAGTREGPEGVGQPSGLPYLPLDGDVPARPGNAYALSNQAGEQQKALRALLVSVDRTVPHDLLHTILLGLAGLDCRPRRADQGRRDEDRERPRTKGSGTAPDGPQRTEGEEWKQHDQHDGKVYDGGMKRVGQHGRPPRFESTVSSGPGGGGVNPTGVGSWLDAASRTPTHTDVGGHVDSDGRIGRAPTGRGADVRPEPGPPARPERMR